MAAVLNLSDTTGIIDYGSLIYMTLQRAKNAREAIATFSQLVSDYGYASSGESFSIADANEAWILELIGKGPGKKEQCGLHAGFLMDIFRDMPTIPG